MPNCKINNKAMKINVVHRTKNGDIVAFFYCYSEGDSRKKELKKITHEECSKNKKVIYKNGEGYDKNTTIRKNNAFSNLIKCFCKPHYVKGTKENFPHNYNHEEHKKIEENRRKISISNLV